MPRVRAEEAVAEASSAVGDRSPPKQLPQGAKAPSGGASTGDQASDARVVLIVAKDSPRCAAELARLRRRGGVFEKMRAAGWRIGDNPRDQIQIVDRDHVPELIQKLNPREYPVVASIERGQVVRSFQSGCTTPLDAWTFGFLAKGIDERPPGSVLEAARVASTGNYRLRGNHWSVEGNWNPTREYVLEHLLGANHTGQLEPQWQIDSWSYEELRSLHDDLHERYDMPSSSRKSSKSKPLKGYR